MQQIALNKSLHRKEAAPYEHGAAELSELGLEMNLPHWYGPVSASDPVCVATELECPRYSVVDAR